MGVSVKVNLKFEIGRFGLVVRVGGKAFIAEGRMHRLVLTPTGLLH